MNSNYDDNTIIDFLSKNKPIVPENGFEKRVLNLLPLLSFEKRQTQNKEKFYITSFLAIGAIAIFSILGGWSVMVQIIIGVISKGLSLSSITPDFIVVSLLLLGSLVSITKFALED